MVRMVLKIDGMACSMCEAHVNDAIRRAFPVKKVVSSHGKGQTEILAEAEIPQDWLAAVLQDTGYRLSQRTSAEMLRREGRAWALGAD